MINKSVSQDLIQCILSLLLSSYYLKINPPMKFFFAYILGIFCIGSYFLPFLSLNFLKENIKLIAFSEIIYAIY